MEISNPRRILVLGPPDAGALKVLKDLTGSAPEPIDTSTAGLTHTWNLKTAYYTVDLSIWIDEIPSLSSWRVEFEKEEAKEVIEAVGAWIYIFRKPITASDVEGIKEAMTAIKGIIEKACGEYWEGCCLAVGTRQSVTTSLKLEGEAWEDFCRETGFEYVDAEGKGKNEYGEPVGIERMREALETTEWEGGDGEGDIEEEFGFTDGGEGWEGLAGEEAEMSVELLGMKGAMHGETSEDEKENADEQVEEMGRMMNRLLAIKDTTSAMPEQERKKFAAKAVKDFMKDV